MYQNKPEWISLNDVIKSVERVIKNKHHIYLIERLEFKFDNRKNPSSLNMIKIVDVNEEIKHAKLDGIINEQEYNELIKTIDFESEDVTKFKKPEIARRNKPYSW